MNFNKEKKILVLAPHIDDVELGMAGTLYRISKISASRIYYISFSRPPDVEYVIFDKEFEVANAHFNIPAQNYTKYDFDPRDLARDRSAILQILYEVNKDLKPDIVFLPSRRDMHQSHQVVCEEGMRVFKNTTVLGYELPWNNFELKGDLFVVLSEEEVEKKKEIISAFKTQMKRSFFSNNVLIDLARVRGKQISRSAAEAFDIIRMVVD